MNFQYGFSIQLKATACYISPLGRVHLILRAQLQESVFRFPIMPTSQLVFILCLLYPMQLPKDKANFSPTILALTSFIFHFEFFLYFMPAQLSILIVSNKREICDIYFTKLPEIELITALKKIHVLIYFPHWTMFISCLFPRPCTELTQSRAK